MKTAAMKKIAKKAEKDMQKHEKHLHEKPKPMKKMPTTKDCK
jgi:hypothetical protein